MPIQQTFLGLGGAGDGQWITYMDNGYQTNSGYTTHGDYNYMSTREARVYNKHIWAACDLRKIGGSDESRWAIIKMKTDGTLVDTVFMDTTVANGAMQLYGYTVDHDDNLYVMTGATYGTMRTYLAKYNSSFSLQFKVKLGPDLDTEAYVGPGCMIYVPSTDYSGGGSMGHSILAALADGWCFIGASNGTPGNYVETNWDPGLRISGYYAANPVHVGAGVIYNTIPHRKTSSSSKLRMTLIQMDKGDRSLDRISPDGIDDYAKSPDGTNLESETISDRCNDYKLIGGKKYIYHIDKTEKANNQEKTFLVWRYNLTDDATTMYGGVAHNTSTNSTAGGGCIKADDDGTLWGVLQYSGDSAFERATSSNGKWAYECWIVQWDVNGAIQKNWRVRFDEAAFPENWETERTHNLSPVGIDMCPDGDLFVCFDVKGSQAWWHSNYTGTQSAFEHGSGRDFHIFMKIKKDGTNLGTHGWVSLVDTGIPNSPSTHPSVSTLDDGPGYSNTSGAFANSMQSGNGFAVQSSNNTQDSHSNTAYDSDYSHWSAVKTEL